MKFEVGKFYKTRSGLKVRVEIISQRPFENTRLPADRFKMAGTLYYPDDDYKKSNGWQDWWLDGTVSRLGWDHDYDLVEEWHDPPVKGEGYIWINQHNQRVADSFAYQQPALPIRRIKVKWEEIPE